VPEIPGVTITYTDYDGSGNPRLINLPDTDDRTVQDLIDTLSAKNAELDNLIYATLFLAKGKDELNPVEDVGLTLRLENAKLKVADQGTDTIIQVGQGNTIAFDSGGSAFYPADFSAKVNWIIAQSTSTAIVNTTVKYDGAVWIDAQRGTAGTTVQVNGTITNPVTTIADARVIADALGLRRYNIRKTSGGPLTLGSAHDDWQFIGVGEGVVVGLAGQDVDGSFFMNMELSGASNGSIRAEACTLDGVTELEGLIANGWIRDSLAMPVAGGGFLVVHNCSSATPGPDATPILAVGGAGNEYNFRGYNGGIEITGSTLASNVGSIDMVAGQIILGSTNTAGKIALRGTGKLNKTGVGAITIDQDGFGAFNDQDKNNLGALLSTI
jgi:hypothetical protein